MKTGFMPISIEDYIDLFLKSNSHQDRKALEAAFQDALSAYRHGVKCSCGDSIWVIGSALSEYGCFSCLTRKQKPEGDYEISEACEDGSGHASEVDLLRIQTVDDIIRSHPDNYLEELEKVGFTYFDDDEYEQEEKEEKEAIPETDDQERLVTFFEEGGAEADAMIELFINEKNQDNPNLPLFRKYFKLANPNLKKMILAGLDKTPIDADLLADLSFFHEYSGILPELINRYKTACSLENDLANFAYLVTEFYWNTMEDGYDALEELISIYDNTPQKLEIVRKKKDEIEMALEIDPEDIVL